MDEESEARWDQAQDGAEMLAQGDVEGAIQVLQALTEEAPDNEYGFFYLGGAYFEEQAYVKALRAYLTALELAPAYLGAMLGVAETFRRLGRYVEAIRMGKQVLARAQDDQDALFLLGACHFSLGDEAAARKYLRRFIDSRPEIEAAIEAEGMLQVLAGDIESPDEQDA